MGSDSSVCEMPKKIWTAADIPPQNGKIVLITGATSGLGYETALVLAKVGAHVILGGRNEEKGNIVMQKIREICPNANIEFGKVDQTSLSSVKEFAATLTRKLDRLDILMNNAGIHQASNSQPKREVTEDGFEITFQTNHLSHFALTAMLLPLLRESPAPRVVNVSSLMAHSAKINFEDLQFERDGYGDGISAYAQSKLANLLFTLELQRKSDLGGWGLASMAAHPGAALKDIDFPRAPGFHGFLATYIVKPYFSHSMADGALPQIFAAVAPEAEKSGYYGPSGFYEMKGPVGTAKFPSIAKDFLTATKLWDVSVILTGVTWPDK